MPESDQSPSNRNDPLDVLKVVKLASDQVALEKAFRLIDSYIAEKWQSPTSMPPDRSEAA